MRFTPEDILLPVEIAGLRFRNPFYVASGPTTMTVEQLKRIEETGWGGASLKLTIDPAPYINRHPRYGYWAGDGILSFTTERRLPIDDGLRLMEAGRKATRDIVLLSNLTYAGDRGVEGWAAMAKKFEDAGAHANEINMCCPNMSYNVELSEGQTCGPKTGASLGQNADALTDIVKAIREATRIPLFIKLTPEGGRIAQVARACYAAGADVVGGTANRLAIHHVDLDDPTRSPIRLQQEISMQCMASDWVHPLALRDIYEIRKLNGPSVLVSGAGGIRDWRTAAEALLCGANLLGICAETVISGFGFLPRLVIELKAWLEKRGVTDLRALSNVVPPAITAASNVTLYAGNARLKDRTLSAPCVDACPAHVPAQAYISKIADGEYREAFDIITSSQPLQSICGYICNHPCEEVCTRGEKDEALRIKDLKRFVLDMGRREGWEPAGTPLPPNGRRVAVVGSGPSGLTAAVLLRRAGYDVTVIESASAPGGMLRFAIPLFRLPLSLLKAEITAIRKLGVRFELNRTLGKDVGIRDLRARYDGVYVAIGAQQSVPLSIKGEGARGCTTAVDFLKAVCLGRKTGVGKKVAVIGGSFTAFDAARTALRLGAEEVYILYRRTKDEMPAEAEEIREAEEEGVKIMYLVTPRQIVRSSGKVTGIRMASCVLGGSDGDGRRVPEQVTGAEFVLRVDTVISAIGQSADLAGSEGLRRTAGGTIEVDDEGFTGTSGVYAGGDATLGSASVIEAIACGRRAAHALDRELSGGTPTIAPLESTRRVDVEGVLTRKGGDVRAWRVPLALVSPGRRRKTFTPYRRALSEAEAKAEASRCYRCGCGIGCQLCHDGCKMFAWDIEGTRVQVREKDCVACGMCAWRCPNGNIEMVQTGSEPI